MKEIRVTCLHPAYRLNGTTLTKGTVVWLPESSLLSEELKRAERVGAIALHVVERCVEERTTLPPPRPKNQTPPPALALAEPRPLTDAQVRQIMRDEMAPLLAALAKLQEAPPAPPRKKKG